jgi:hypothetical protein
MVIVASQTQGAGVVAYDKQTGNLVWKTAGLPGKVGYMSPILVKISGTDQVMMLSGAGMKMAGGGGPPSGGQGAPGGAQGSAPGAGQGAAPGPGALMKQTRGRSVDMTLKPAPFFGPIRPFSA